MKTTGFSVSDRQYSLELLSFSMPAGRIKAGLTYNLVKQLNFTPEEIEELSIKEHENGLITATKDKIIDVNLSTEQIEILKECALLADEQQAIHFSMIPLINKIDNL